MVFVHHAPQTRLGGVGVDLRGGDVGVTKHLLHGSKIRAVIEEVCGEGVTQLVRRQGGRDACPQGVA